MSPSDHPNVIAFDNGLPHDGLASFIRQVVDDLKLKKKILRLPKKRSTNEEAVRRIYEDCMRAALRQVGDNLEEIFGENWSFEVVSQYMLNGKDTDLGIKYKDTELYKAYIMGPDVTGGLRMLYDLEKSPIPDLNAAETTTDAIAAPITPSDSPPADNLLPIDPDLVNIDDHPIAIDHAHDTSHAVITDGPIADPSEDEDEEVDVAVGPAVTHWGYLFSPIQSKIGTNATSTSTSIRKSRNHFDITLLAVADQSEKSDYGGAQLVGGVVEVRYVSEKEVEGTVLAIPSEALGIKEEFITKSKKGIDDHPSASGSRTPRGEPDLTEVTNRPLSFFTRRTLQDLIAQIIWGLINVDAMSTTRRPVYGMAVLNGWFVRMVVDGTRRVLYLETMDPTRISTNTNTTTDRKTSTNHQSPAPKSNSLKDLLTWFQYGRFPHHLATNSGVEKIYRWTIAGFRSYVLPAALATNGKDDPNSTTTRSSTVATRTDLKRGTADVFVNEALEGMDRQKRIKTIREGDMFQARDPAGPSTSYQAIKEKAENTVPDEPRRKVNTWLSKIDDNPEVDQQFITVDLDDSPNADEDDDIHNSSYSQEYRDYCTMVGQMEFLDQISSGGKLNTARSPGSMNCCLDRQARLR
jgi:hypothetical protein